MVKYMWFMKIIIFSEENWHPVQPYIIHQHHSCTIQGFRVGHLELRALYYCSMINVIYENFTLLSRPAIPDSKLTHLISLINSKNFQICYPFWNLIITSMLYYSSEQRKKNNYTCYIILYQHKCSLVRDLDINRHVTGHDATKRPGQSTIKS